MNRTMTAAMLAALKATVVKPAFFVWLDLDTPVRLWSGVGDKVMSAYSDTDLNGTYTGLGDLEGIAFPPETSSGASGGMSFGLSGIPSATTAIALGENYRNNLCKFWFGAIDLSTGAIVPDPYLQFWGLIDSFNMSDDGRSSSISVGSEGYAYGLGPSTSRWTDEEQRRRFPDDLGLKNVAGLGVRDVIWGAAATISPATIPPDYHESEDPDFPWDG